MSPKTVKTFVAYFRVSTQRQGRSGLGLEAQRHAVDQFVAGRGRLLGSYTEVESGKRNDRPELDKALKRCRATGATLVVAKLDRLSRNLAFLATLRDSGVQFVAADMPDANTLTIGVMASLAQHEREVISERTKLALAAAKRRGVQLGGLREGSPDIRKHQREGVKANQARAEEHLRDVADDLLALAREGLSLRAMAARLNEAEVKTPMGCAWTAMGVRRAMIRLGR